MELNTRIFVYQTLVQESDLDSFGHVNNANYLKLCEHARWDFISENGYGFDKIQETKKGPVILDVYLKFLRELKARETITIESYVLEQGKKIGKLAQDIKKSDGTMAAKAVFTMGFWDTEARKLIPLTGEWKQAIGL